MADLVLSNVQKSFGKTEVIKGVDLMIPAGNFTVFVGPSGCGKSTLLRLIAGLEDVTGGDILLENNRVNDQSPAERGVAMVFQSYALYPHLSVRKNLSFGLENMKMPKTEIEKRVADVAAMLQIEQYLERKPKALSGGQRQRVAIGRSIVRDPTLFLFDEPLSNLDAQLRVEMRAEICNLHKRLNTTMIYVTHDQVEAMTMAEQIVVLRDGKVEQVGEPMDLFNNPANMFVAGFIGSPKMNFLPATADVDRIILGEGREIARDPCANAGQSLMIGIRPSHLKRSAEGRFTLQVSHVEPMGHETFVHGRIEGVETDIVLHESGNLVVSAGDTLNVDLPADLIHVFDADTGLTTAREKKSS